MPLPWFRLDTNFPKHDKVVELIDAGDKGRAAAFVYVCGLAYCADVESDGFIPFGALPFMHGRRRDAELLVEHGMWKPHPRGWEVVNYLNRQPSAAVLKEQRADKVRASSKGNCVRWHGPDCGCWKRSD